MFSIRRKFNTGILVVAIFSTILTGFVSILQGRKVVESEAKKVLLLTATNYANQFETELSKLQLHERSLESFIHSVCDSTADHSLNINKKQLANFIELYCHKNSIFSLWVVFNPDYIGYPLVLSMYDSLGTHKYVFEPNYDIRELNQNGDETKWWRDAIKYGEVWTAPYYWKPWDKYLISYSKSLKKGGSTIAVLGSDFNFNQLKESIKNFKIYETGFIWMMDSSLNLISHPIHEGQNLKTLDTTKQIYSYIKSHYVNEGIIEYTDRESLKKIMAIKKLSNGWYICVTAPKSEILKGSNLIFRFIAIIILISIVLGAFISSKISRAITKPLNQFVESFVKGATGDFSIRVPEKSKDELRLLESHFNHFLEKTQRLVQELNETQKSLIVAKDDAVKSNKLKTSFLANMSHEIRTPLNAVIGFTNLLKMQNIPESEKAKFIDLAISSSYNLLSIVESIIEFSSLEVGLPEMKPTSFKVNDFLVLIEEYIKVNIKYQLPDNVCYIVNQHVSDTLLFTDPDKLRRIIYHLMDNALKFSNEGVVELGYNVKNENVEFFIKDNGVGIKKENEKLIWESFYKVDFLNQRFNIGAGLGLSICKRLTNLLNGRIWFESEEGKGTTFFLSIPIVKPDKKIVITEKIYHYPEILVVDEDIDSFRVIHEKIVKLGLKDLWARNGVEALGLIAMEPSVKLVICNLFSNTDEGILSIQLIKNINAKIRTLVIGDPKKIKEMKDLYCIDFDFYTYDFIDEGILQEIITFIKQKEQQ